ncbi:hypothetical protein IK5_05826 [Bacillus cereus VD154]|uniref:Uncharacterized protein n=2 Tax=Bacillus cereus TaxID=1396 RepID=A0A9W5KRK4_BACCE|nr:hypothetical protein IK5_05826 [Bacillus cereus VD154]
MKKLRMLSGLCVAGMLMLTGVAGCSNETKSNANQQESQKERDMKEADKAVMDYVKAYIEVDSGKLAAFVYEPFDFVDSGVRHPGASQGMGGRYDLYRYDLEEGENEFYYGVKFFDPVEDGPVGMELKMVKDEKDGKWKNYGWTWDWDHNFESIVGSVEPVHVHKWGQKE